MASFASKAAAASTSSPKELTRFGDLNVLWGIDPVPAATSKHAQVQLFEARPRSAELTSERGRKRRPKPIGCPSRRSCATVNLSREGLVTTERHLGSARAQVVPMLYF